MGSIILASLLNLVLLCAVGVAPARRVDEDQQRNGQLENTDSHKASTTWDISIQRRTSSSNGEKYPTLQTNEQKNGTLLTGPPNIHITVPVGTNAASDNTVIHIVSNITISNNGQSNTASEVIQHKYETSFTNSNQAQLAVPVRTNIAMTNTKFSTGSTISIPCSVQGYPEPKVAWYKDGRRLATSDNIQISENSKLTIKSVTRKDSGTYRCQASNEHSFFYTDVWINVQDDPWKAEAQPAMEVGVNRIGAVATPTIVKTRVSEPLGTKIFMENTNFPKGSTISIPCTVKGYPVPKIVWYKDGRPLTSSDRIQILGTIRLMVQHATKEDSGTYRCHATNQNGYVYSDIFINVQEYYKPESDPVLQIGNHNDVIQENKVLLSVPVRTKIVMGSTNFPTGSTIVIPCSVEGYPVPKVVWYKDGIPLKTSDRTQTTGNSRLTIQRAGKEDTGTYKCLATQMGGFSYSEIFINVQGPLKPGVPIATGLPVTGVDETGDEVIETNNAKRRAPDT